MHSNDTKDQFLELRAKGLSLARIATDIHVSQRTLVEWNRQLAPDICALRAVHLEALHEQILASRQEDLTRLAKVQANVEAAITERDFSWVDSDKLVRIYLDLRHEIRDLRAADLSPLYEPPNPKVVPISTALQRRAAGPGGPETVSDGFPPPPSMPLPAEAPVAEPAGNLPLTAIDQFARRLQGCLRDGMNRGILGLAASLSACFSVISSVAALPRPISAPFLHCFRLTFSTALFTILSVSTTSAFPPLPMVQFCSIPEHPQKEPPFLRLVRPSATPCLKACPSGWGKTSSPAGRAPPPRARQGQPSQIKPNQTQSR
jgi:hypothetical protein